MTLFSKIRHFDQRLDTGPPPEPRRAAPPPPPPEGIQGEDYARWLRRNEPEIFLRPGWDDGAEPLVTDGPDLPWPAERAPAGLTFCGQHQSMIWQSIAGDWRCVGCWAESPPPRGFVQRVAGLMIEAGVLWIVFPPHHNCWPECWGPKPGTQDTKREFT